MEWPARNPDLIPLRSLGRRRVYAEEIRSAGGQTVACDNVRRVTVHWIPCLHLRTSQNDIQTEHLL